MTVEVTPLGVACQLACTYCYQTPMRDAGNIGASAYDMEAMKAALRAQGSPFTVFGGESLLVPIPDLEELFTLGLELYEKRRATGARVGQPNAVQTNGALITDEHVALFKKYNVHVGFSLDGPGDLNDARWAGSVEKTRLATDRSQTALERLLEEGVGTSLILTLHRGNVGTPERFARVVAWLKDLDERGLQSARLHILEVENETIERALTLSPSENAEIMNAFAALELPTLHFDVFADIATVLTDPRADVTCTWSPCDPYTTSAVQGIGGHGEKSNCGRTNKQGVAWVKADVASHERQWALYNTPQEHGGCQGCRFFLQCKGQCPGTAIDGDWRNRSRDCLTWKTLLEQQERLLLDRGIIPQSVGPDRIDRERAFLVQLRSRNKQGGYNHAHGDSWEHGDDHGDHTDRGGNAHGDSPHGDDHGDHTDHGNPVHGDDHGDGHGDEHGDHTDLGRMSTTNATRVRRTNGS